MITVAKLRNFLAVWVFAMLLIGCAGETRPAPDEVNDPYEATNREIHAFNKAVDRALLGPASNLYGAITLPEFRLVLGNAVSNLGEPNAFVNHVLQGDVDGAGTNLLRFVLNSTIGIAGISDPAAELGIFSKPTDFGETLGVWGVAEGPYIELPLLGPSSVRDAVGRLVDLGIDPVKYALTDEQATYLLAARALNLLGTRHEYADLLEALLYESADSYTAQRLSYLQNKRHAFAGETTVDDLEDPYAFE